MAPVKKMKIGDENFTFQSRQTEGYVIICIKGADVSSSVMKKKSFILNQYKKRQYETKSCVTGVIKGQLRKDKIIQLPYCLHQ
jgi:hypothetical protein